MKKKNTIREMNKEIFLKFFDMALEEIKEKEGLTVMNDAFIINPVVEAGKMLEAKDEVMRLNVIPQRRVRKHIYTKNEVVSMLTFFTPLVPLWINIEYIPQYRGENAVFRLSCSVRLRKPSLLWNQESGHPPFRVIVRESPAEGGEFAD